MARTLGVLWNSSRKRHTKRLLDESLFILALYEWVIIETFTLLLVLLRSELHLNFCSLCSPIHLIWVKYLLKFHLIILGKVWLLNKFHFLGNPSWKMWCLKLNSSISWHVPSSITNSKNSFALKHRIEFRHWLCETVLEACVMISSEKLRKVKIAICIELSKTQKIIENLWKFCSLFVTTEVCI